MSPEATPSLDSNPQAGRATTDYPELHALTVTQARAVDALLAGCSHARAAEEAGVHRITVTRWANHHPAFIAALNIGKVDHANEMRARVAHLTRLALDAMETALASGDARLAVQWLRIHEPVVSADDAPTTPEGVVEGVRATMPTELDAAIATYERSTSEAEAAIANRAS